MASIGKGIVAHDFHIHARRLYDRLGVQLYLYQKRGDGRLGICEIEHTERGPYIKQTIIDHPNEGMILDEASGFKPFLVIDEPLYRELLSAMMRLGDEENIPRPSEDHMRGKLDATEKHLLDVQHMLEFTTRLINRTQRGVENGINRTDQGDGYSLSGLSERAQ